jgi:hypothetical protein
MYTMDTERGTSKDALVEGLKEARERTRFLLGPVSEEDLVAQHDPIMSPLIWDFGHIGNYEELWLLQEAHGKTLSKRELYDMYDARCIPARSARPWTCSIGPRATATSARCARRSSKPSKPPISTGATRSSKRASSTT